MYYLKNFKNMTKRFIFSVAAIAIMLVSCSQNDQEVVNIPTSDAISLNPSTAVTRASVTNFNTLQTSTDGFRVYATSGALTAWYQDADGKRIDGNNHHKWDNVSGKWGFEYPGVKWPTDASGYPMTFWAIYPVSHTAMTIAPTNPTSTDLSLNVTIPAHLDNQIDILSTKGSTNVKPATANLSLNFKHILSKVNFKVSTTENDVRDSAFVQAVGFNGIYNANNFNVISQGWNGNGHTGKTEFNYYNRFIPESTPNNTILEVVKFNNIEDAPFYPGATDKNMMLLPQSPDMWKPQVGVTPPGNLPKTGDAYVRVMYRFELTTDKDYIGFRSALDHPDYEGSEAQDKGYVGPLFVLAGYTYEGIWVEGKGFMYNIPLPGTSGGRLLDERLYDDKGNPTDLTLPGGEEGEPIITTDEYIHLIPVVTEWGDDIEKDLGIN